MAWQAALLKGFKGASRVAQGVQTAKTVKGAIGGSKKKGGVSVKKERPKMGQFVKDVEQTKVETAPKQKLVPTLALPQAAPPGEEKSKKIKEKIGLLLKFVRERRALKEGRRKQKEAAQVAAKRKEEENKKENLSKGLVKGGKKIAGAVTRPITSIWDNIMNAIGTIILGQVAMWAVDNPKLFATILKTLKVIGDVVANVTIAVLDIFAGVVDFGYTLVEGLEWLVGKTLGDDAAKKLEEWIPNITGFLNGAIILGQVMVAKAMWEAKQVPGKGQLPKPIKNVLRKWRVIFKKFIFKWKRRAIRLLKRLIKIIGGGIRVAGRVISNVVKRAKPLQTLQNLTKPLQKPLQNLTKPLRNLNLGKTLKNIKPLERVRNLNLGKNLSRIQPGKRVQDVVKNVRPVERLSNLGKKFKLPKITPKPGGGGWLSGIRSGIGKGWQATKGAVISGAQATGSAISGAWKGASEWTTKNLGSMWKGAKEWGAAQAKKLGDIAELAKNPKKLAELMKSKLTKSIDDVVKNNKTLKNLLELAKNPKRMGGAIKGMLNNAKKSKGIINFKAALTKAKATVKIGGIDKLIAAVMALIDYTVLKESPVNAIIKAVSGMLGYAAGFAIGAPFGGFPGFVTGMAGGALGELAGYGLLKGLAMIPGVTDIPDPIMDDGRPLLRDPDSPMDHMLDDDLKITKDHSGDKKDDKKDTSDLSDKKDQKPEPTSDNTTKVSSNDAKMNGVPSSSAQSVSTLNEGGAGGTGEFGSSGGSTRAGDQAIIPLPSTEAEQPKRSGGVVVSTSTASLNNYKSQVQGQMYKN